jgi:hypothetical protein
MMPFYRMGRVRFSNGKKAANETDLISRWKKDISERELKGKA